MNVHADLKPMLVSDNKAWVVSGYDNFLYEIDVDKWDATFIEKVKMEGNDPWRGNYAGVVYKNKIICLPDRNDKIAIYDITTENLTYIDMPRNNFEHWDVTAYILKEDILYMFSRTQKMIIKADLITASCEVYDKLDIDKQIIVLASKDKFMFITLGEQLELYSYNLWKRTVQKEFSIENKKKYTTFLCDGENVWFSGMRKNFLCWNSASNLAREIDFSQFDIYEYLPKLQEDCYYKANEEEFAEPLFANQFVYGNYIWFVPLRSSHIIRVNKYDYRVEMIELPDEEETFRSWNLRIGGLNALRFVFEFINQKGNLLIYSYKNQVHYVIDADTGKLKETKSALKTVNITKKIETILNENMHLTEGINCSLNYLLKYVINN